MKECGCVVEMGRAVTEEVREECQCVSTVCIEFRTINSLLPDRANKRESET